MHYLVMGTHIRNSAASPKPSLKSWLERVRSRKRAAKARVLAGQILKSRDADRR
jgi:hypothetical protein